MIDKLKDKVHQAAREGLEPLLQPKSQITTQMKWIYCKFTVIGKPVSFFSGHSLVFTYLSSHFTLTQFSVPSPIAEAPPETE